MYFPILDILPIPFRTDRTLRSVPYVTYALLFLNLFVYLLNLGLSDYQFHQVTLHWGFIIEKPSLLTLFTMMFLHANLSHLLGNLLLLWLIGTVLESGIGSVTFALLYFASGITAVIINGLIAHTFFPDTLSVPLIGASGAISGITGFAALRFHRLRALSVPLVSLTWLPIPIPIPLLIWMPLWVFALWFALRELLMGLLNISTLSSDSVAHWAHIGGLLLGVLAAMLLQVMQEGQRESVLEDSTRARAGAPQQRTRRDVQRMLQEHPDDPEMLEAMAALTLVNGEHTRSRELYARAIPLFLERGQRERAASCYRNILHLEPDMVLGAREQMTVAATLEAMRHFPEAAQAFHLMADHYPRLEEAQTALLRAAIICHRYLDNPLESRRLLQQLQAQYPDSPWSGVARERLLALEKDLP